jgi:hypothetical protein
MLAAGWKRGEFRAHTPVEVLHGIPTYGQAIVTTFGVQKTIELTSAMQAQGLSLIHFARNGVVICVHISNDGRGKLEHYDLDARAEEKQL